MARIYDDEPGVKVQWAKLKGQPLKVKLEYFFQYYGIMTAAIIGIILLVVFTVVSMVKNSVPKVVQGESYALFLDTTPAEGFKEELCEKLGIDPEKHAIEISYSMGSDSGGDYYQAVQMKLAARVAAGDLDFLIGTEKLIQDYAATDGVSDSFFLDLRNVMSSETFEALSAEGRIHYAKVQTGEEIPCYIDITGSRFYERFSMTAKAACVAFVVTAPHPEALPFVCEYFVSGDGKQ